MRGRRFRDLRRLLGGRRLSTIALIVVAAGLVVIAALTIIDRTALHDGDATTGVVPDEMPDGFPLPVSGVIGANTVDAATYTVTLEVTTAGSLVDAISTYTIGLVSSDYVVDRSEARGDGWTISFRRLDLRGTIDLALVDGGVLSLITIRDP